MKKKNKEEKERFQLLNLNYYYFSKKEEDKYLKKDETYPLILIDASLGFEENHFGLHSTRVHRPHDFFTAVSHTQNFSINSS